MLFILLDPPLAICCRDRRRRTREGHEHRRGSKFAALTWLQIRAFVLAPSSTRRLRDYENQHKRSRKSTETRRHVAVLPSPVFLARISRDRQQGMLFVGGIPGCDWYMRYVFVSSLLTETARVPAHFNSGSWSLVTHLMNVDQNGSSITTRLVFIDGVRALLLFTP